MQSGPNACLILAQWAEEFIANPKAASPPLKAIEFCNLNRLLSQFFPFGKYV